MEEKKTISLSVTLEEYKLIKIAAECKGMKPSGYCKMAAFTYLSKSPPRGVLAELARQRTESK